MILVDMGPLIALFDPCGALHARCRENLEPILCTARRRLSASCALYLAAMIEVDEF